MAMLPEAIVQAQVEAYNRRDLESFLATYADAVELYTFPYTPLLAGKDDLRERYRRRFAENPDLHAEIHNRLVFENTVVDLETASGVRFGRKTCLAIYEVNDDLIGRVTFKMPAD